MAFARVWVCCFGAGLALCGCASSSTPAAPPRHAQAEPAKKPPDRAAPAVASSGDPAKDLAEARSLEQQQLGIAARDARFATDRQIAMLKRAKLLYQAFIERAKDNPEMSDAMQRSRDRIEDIDKTIDFLESSAEAP